jgi:hypothetical protein
MPASIEKSLKLVVCLSNRLTEEIFEIGRHDAAIITKSVLGTMTTRLRTLAKISVNILWEMF